MNRARAIAALMELLDALEEDGPLPTVLAMRKPRRLPVRPEGEVDEVTRARTRSILRAKGYRDA